MDEAAARLWRRFLRHLPFASHYRRLVLENHPDKLMARGVPKEFVAIATEKVSAINEAYGQIAKERRI
jgi:DnaJ like chaperone protein